MSIKNNKADNFVYVKVPYCGFIPVLNVRGPIRASYISKENIQKLIRGGYDVEFINKNAFPEFQEQMAKYKKACEAKDYVGAKAILATPLDVNPNSLTQTAIDSTAGIPTNPGATQQNPTEAALNAVNGGVGSEPNAGTDESVNDDITQQMANVENGGNAEEGAGASIFDGNAEDDSGNDEPVDDSNSDMGIGNPDDDFIDEIPTTPAKKGGKKGKNR